MKLLHILFLYTFLVFNVDAHENLETKCKLQGNVERCDVSMIDLLSHSTYFDGRLVRVTGYYYGYTNGLYLSESHIHTRKIGYSILINLHNKEQHPQIERYFEYKGIQWYIDQLVKSEVANGYYSEVIGIFKAANGREYVLLPFESSIEGVKGFLVSDDRYEDMIRKKRAQKRMKEANEKRKQMKLMKKENVSG